MSVHVLVRSAASLAMVLAAQVEVACSAGGGSGPASSAARRALARDVLQLMDRQGLPVMFDRIECPQPGSGTPITCYGSTAFEPEATVIGVFRGSAAASPTGGCPGSLTISLDLVPVTSSAEDPCR